MKKFRCTQILQTLVFGVTLLCHTSLFAQDTKVLKFRHINIENGMYYNNVRALLQDKYGYIWIGSGYGISRYDGHWFSCPRGPKTKASCQSLCEVGDTVWIGTNEGLTYYSHKCDSIALFDKKTKDGVSISSNVTRIMPDMGGNLWIATFSQGLFCYTKEGTLKQYLMPEGEKIAASVLATSSGDIWVISNWSKHDLVKLNKNTDKFEPVKINVPEGQSIRPGGIFLTEGKNGVIWLGTWMSGLVRLDPKTMNATIAAKNDGEHLNHIHWITANEDGHLYVTSDQGLCIYNPETSEATYYDQDELSPYAIDDRYTYPIIFDKEGALWMGTYFRGLEYSHPKASEFTNYTQSSYRNSVSGNIISNFREDKYGNIWIGSDDGGLSSFNKATKQFRSYETHGAKENRNIHGMCLDGDILYIGTYSTGVDAINVKTGEEKHYPSLPGIDGKNYGVSAYSILKGRNGKIWLGTFNHILTFDSKTGKCKPEKETNNVVIDIKEDKHGNIWCCADEDGVYRYDYKKKTWKKYEDFEHNKNEYDAKVIANSIYEDMLGEIWLASSYGIYKYDKKKDKFVSLALRSGHPDVKGITGEGSDLWLASPNSLIVFSTATNEVIREYKSGDGMGNTNFIQNAIFRGTDGTIYLGTTNGFTSFNPSQMKGSIVSQKVVFTEIELFNKTVLVGSDHIKENLNTVDEVEFSYKENSLRIFFSAMSYLMPLNNTYQYYLEGYEDDWNTPTHEHSATYTNLAPGTYVLHVRATNNDGVWNDEEATLTIVITPPFYWNTPVKCIYLILLIMAIYFIIKFFLFKKEKEHIAEINEITTQKEHEVHEARIKYLTISDSDNEFLKRLESTIEKNFSNPEISVDFLAAEMNVSRSGLFAKVKNLADVTPNEMIQIIRLKHAAHLLETKQYRVNEICYMVGFNSPSYFTKCFTKHYGVKPAEYNKQQTQTEQTEEKKENEETSNQ